MHPDRVLRLALVEGGDADFAEVPGFHTDRTVDELISEAEALAAGQGDAFGSHTPAVAGAMIHGLCQEPVTDTYPRLAAPETPVLFVGARRDEPSPSVTRFSRLLPQAEIVEVSSSSHELLRNAPTGIARAVGDWLARLLTDD